MAYGVMRVRFRALVLLALSWSPRLQAEPTPRALSSGYSPYEEAALREAERALGTARDAAPEQKTIEDVVIVRLEPVERRDPLPTALNVLHVESRESTIARELQLRKGMAYSQAQCDESARRLRALPQLSLVMCVALRASRGGRVRVLIVTKDVWSLFLDPDFNFDGGNLQLEPKESNLLGLHHAVFLRYKRDPFSSSWGGNYTIPRFDGQFVTLTADANVLVNQASGASEGSFGAFQARGVARSNRDPWSWFTDLNWFEGYKRTDLLKPRVANDGSLMQARHGELNATAALTRSFGWRYKSDFTLALAGTKSGDWSEGSTDTIFEEALTVPQRRVGPVVEGHFYASDFLRTYEVETLGLQEDFRLGHDLLLKLAPAVRWPSPSQHETEQKRLLLGTSLTAQETLALGNGFARLGAQGALDVAQDGLEAPFVKGWLHLVTPRLGFGRLVADSEITLNLDDSGTRDVVNYSNVNRLRGYAAGQMSGRRIAVANVEYRTPALQLWTEQLGAVLFYDVGAKPGAAAELEVADAVGLGLRIVTPLLERAGLRVDFALPLRRESGREFAWFQLAFGQAFGVPDVTPLKPKRLP